MYAYSTIIYTVSISNFFIHTDMRFSRLSSTRTVYPDSSKGSEIRFEVFFRDGFVPDSADEYLVDGDIGSGIPRQLAWHGSLGLHSSPVNRVRPTGQ